MRARVLRCLGTPKELFVKFAAETPKPPAGGSWYDPIVSGAQSAWNRARDLMKPVAPLVQSAATATGSAATPVVNTIRNAVGAGNVGGVAQPPLDLKTFTRQLTASTTQDQLTQAGEAISRLPEDEQDKARYMLAHQVSRAFPTLVGTPEAAAQRNYRTAGEVGDKFRTDAKTMLAEAKPAAEGGASTWMSYIASNPQFLLLPLGALFAATGWGGNAGRIVGALAALYGGGEMLARYTALREPEQVRGLIAAHQAVQSGQMSKEEFNKNWGTMHQDFLQFATPEAIDKSANKAVQAWDPARYMDPATAAWNRAAQIPKA